MTNLQQWTVRLRQLHNEGNTAGTSELNEEQITNTIQQQIHDERPQYEQRQRRLERRLNRQRPQTYKEKHEKQR